MPPLSPQKKEKIAEQVLHHLFTHAPHALFTSTIAHELARDEEFMKALLTSLAQKKLVVCVTKNAAGAGYTTRKRWRLTEQVYALYKRKQSSSVQHLAEQEHYTEKSNNPY
jgi:hypothetical protein